MLHTKLTIARDANEPLPVTQGRLLDFPDDPIACMRRLHAAHGSVCAMEEDGQRIYFVFGPEYNHQVLSDSNTFHSRFFAIRGGRNSSQRRLSSGLLSMNGDQHKRNRRMVMDAFMKKAILNYLPAIRIEVESMLSDWTPGNERDISRDMTDFMLRLTSSILFGLDQPQVAYKIGHMIDHWVHLNHEIGMGAFVSDPTIANRYGDLLAEANELEGQILGMIRMRKANPTGRDALSMLINAHDAEGSISEEELVGQAALMFAAAHLTTAHSLTWTLFLLAQHPSVMNGLHQELTKELDGGFPTLEQVERLSLTERVIKESMRILPASSYSQRITAVPVELGPFKLAPGAGIVFSQFITHHLPEIYSEPDTFQPDRWLTMAPSPYQYLPFGAGPRMCLGAPLAMLIMKATLPTILQRFKLTVVPNTEVSGKVISTMLGPTTSVMMRIEHQDGRFESQPVRGNIHQMVDLREIRTARRAA
ncbi:cytochrome P450 [Schlesneria paludicola]|uniref:cytochrome P450 n=1 Tax=Schlesneria paludicola TaxID=360056 RepID=UPI00029A6755|nr:cytochrome P450 [Schlesneria paludicola]